MILVIVDTTGIQPYVFGSNRLQENIGASLLVKLATNEWAKEAGAEAGGIEVYAGGGNYLITFETEPQARKFICVLSRWVLERAPDLHLVIASQPFGDEAKLPEAVRCGFVQLAQQKRCRPHSAPLLGLGVTRSCQSTGLPAAGKTYETPEDKTTLYLASATILAKKSYVDKANQALRDLFSEALRDTHYEFPRDFEHLGRSFGEHSFIAVVHADGNSMGQRFQDLGHQCERDGTSYRQQSQKLSETVAQAGQGALCDILSVLLERIRHDTEHSGGKNALIDLWAKDPVTQQPSRLLTTIELERHGQGYYLPFRPLVFGGDDVTFVCDGRLGLALATLFLKCFEALGKTMSDGGEILTACAGVAIVPSHYPFARAYGLAEQLCHAAKAYRHDLRVKYLDKKEEIGSCLDWHFATSGPGSGVDDIRKSEYSVPAGTLHQRPVTLNPIALHGQELRSWLAVRAGVEAFQQQWAERRNKLKALREELRSGPHAVRRFLAQSSIKHLPATAYARDDEPRTTGWVGNQCAHFDAVELADWFIALDEQQPDTQQQKGQQQEGGDSLDATVTASVAE